MVQTKLAQLRFVASKIEGQFVARVVARLVNHLGDVKRLAHTLHELDALQALAQSVGPDSALPTISNEYVATNCGPSLQTCTDCLICYNQAVDAARGRC